tara:strand:+ start:232 stop:477 length:246 start_codon:yes stop_codon:yes gene_type:complete
MLDISFIGDSKMTPNVGTVDRALRLVLGIVLLLAPFVSGMALFTSGVATAISVIAGLVMIGTAAMKFCPLYTLFGIRTCKL